MFYTKTPTELNQLRATELRPPSRKTGRLWRGITHATLLDTLTEEAKERGWEFHLMRHGLHIDTLAVNMVAAADVRIGTTVSGIYPVGVSNSNGGTDTPKVYAGVWEGDFTSHTERGIPLTCYGLGKHTTHAEGKLRGRVRAAFDRIAEDVKKFPSVVKEMKKKKLGGNEANGLLTAAGRKKLMPWSRVGEVDGLLRGRGLPVTAWDLLTHFAAVARKNPPLKQMKQVYQFANLVRSTLE